MKKTFIWIALVLVAFAYMSYKWMGMHGWTLF
jgi:hypothetical protein